MGKGDEFHCLLFFFFYNLSSVSGGYFNALALFREGEGGMNEMMYRWSDVISDLTEPTPNVRVCLLPVYAELQ